MFFRGMSDGYYRCNHCGKIADPACVIQLPEGGYEVLCEECADKKKDQQVFITQEEDKG